MSHTGKLVPLEHLISKFSLPPREMYRYLQIKHLWQTLNLPALIPLHALIAVHLNFPMSKSRGTSTFYTVLSEPILEPKLILMTRWESELQFSVSAKDCRAAISTTLMAYKCASHH